MIQPKTLIRTAIHPALGLLPPHMSSVPAVAMLVAIALQETDLRHREQVGGPARGLWQFEPIGVEGVLTHHASQANAERICGELLHGLNVHELYSAIRDADVLAACFARLALWRYPDALPHRDAPDEGWRQYIAIWAPGKPKPEKWQVNWNAAWSAVS